MDAHPSSRIKAKRKITGSCAILLPFTEQGEIDWDSFRNCLKRTADAGLIPAVNMDTGYANLISEAQRLAVLRTTRETLGGGPFIGGAYAGDTPNDTWNADAYFGQIDAIQEFGGTPIIFQSYGLTQQDNEGIVRSYAAIGGRADAFIAFELGNMFAPFGAIYDLETYEGLMGVTQCIGAKHSSLNRQLEWDRLALRDSKRPDFKVFTGNDLAIDLVMYGSDYLLGLSAFAPDLFARRDAMWERGDPGFYELNDVLQYLGFFSFRPPVPAYKHSAAQFLKLRGWIACDTPHPKGDRRPESDVAVLRDIADRLGVLNGAAS
jgi:dihydrodipicolinate synthase/N-acetylneuraminate lyase